MVLVFELLEVSALFYQYGCLSVRLLSVCLCICLLVYLHCFCFPVSLSSLLHLFVSTVTASPSLFHPCYTCLSPLLLLPCFSSIPVTLVCLHCYCFPVSLPSLLHLFVFTVTASPSLFHPCYTCLSPLLLLPRLSSIPVTLVCLHCYCFPVSLSSLLHLFVSTVTASPSLFHPCYTCLSPLLLLPRLSSIPVALVCLHCYCFPVSLPSLLHLFVSTVTASPSLFHPCYTCLSPLLLFPSLSFIPVTLVYLHCYCFPLSLPSLRYTSMLLGH